MPINFLQNIKSSPLEAIALVGNGFLSRDGANTSAILAIHTFSCLDLKGKQPIFNDGIPSLILMPKKSDTALLKINNAPVLFDSAWLCCGTIKRTYWELPPDLQYILVIRFNPAFFYSFFNISPAVFASKPICNLKDLAADKWMKLFDLIYNKETVESRISFIEKIFSPARIDDTRHNNFPQLVSAALELIDMKQGNTTVNNVLQQIGIPDNPKWLHRNFVKYMGISPKRYIALQRFIYTYERCQTNNVRDYFGAALHSGYYDYNHYLKDFKQYIGVSPTQHTWE